MRRSDRKLLVAAFSTWVALGACRTTGNKSTTSDDTETPVTIVKASLKDAGCLGCHADSGEPEWRVWAAQTKETHTNLASEEAVPSFDPNNFNANGVYVAYPEYFKKYFLDDDKYDAFVDSYRPDPGMRVRGTGDTQSARFSNLLDSMLKLAADPGTGP